MNRAVQQNIQLHMATSEDKSVDDDSHKRVKFADAAFSLAGTYFSGG